MTLLAGRHIAVAEAVGLGDWLAVQGEKKKGVNTATRLPAWVTRWKKKTLTQTADARESSRFGFKIDIRPAKNRSQVFGDKQIANIKEP